MLPAKIDERFHIAIKMGRKIKKKLYGKKWKYSKNASLALKQKAPTFLEKLKNQKYLYKKTESRYKPKYLNSVFSII